jgi:hypothetical protein
VFFRRGTHVPHRVIMYSSIVCMMKGYDTLTFREPLSFAPFSFAQDKFQERISLTLDSGCPRVAVSRVESRYSQKAATAVSQKWAGYGRMNGDILLQDSLQFLIQ